MESPRASSGPPLRRPSPLTMLLLNSCTKTPRTARSKERIPASFRSRRFRSGSHGALDPVEHLKSVAENVGLGNLEIGVRRYSEDEIGDLADSFSRMVTAVKFFRMDAGAVRFMDADKAKELSVKFARL